MKIVSFVFVVFSFHTAAAQSDFDYRRPVSGNAVSGGWHSMTIPSELFVHSQQNLEDLRLFTFTGKDTIENPFVLRIRHRETTRESVSLPVVNESRKGEDLFVSFINSGKTLNHISLDFQENNYFAMVDIEGSHHNKEWFTIAKDQKIFSVSNAYESFKSGDLYFPDSNYEFFRLTIRSATRLSFVKASFDNDAVKEGKYVEVAQRWTVNHDKKNKRTTLLSKFKDYQPVTDVTIDIRSANDYYRSAAIEVLTDSFKTEKGWIRNYRQVFNGYLSSIRANEISFDAVSTSEVRVTIYNYDNAPLDVSNVTVQRPEFALLASITSGQLYLYYGNTDISKPVYDIEHFDSKIPDAAPPLTLGNEETLRPADTHPTSIFDNKAWLYAIMFVVIAVIGYFTLKMMKANPQQS